MQIKIKERPIILGESPNFRKAMQEIAGEWVNVETEYLFENQYNVTTPSGHSLRIMQEHVDEVKNDIRHNKTRCNYCGKTINLSEAHMHPCEEKHIRPFRIEKKEHTHKVNKNWSLQFSTQYGKITPYEKAEITIINHRTSETFIAQKWELHSTLYIEKKVPQSVKNALRHVLKKYDNNGDYRNIRENDLIGGVKNA